MLHAMLLVTHSPQAEMARLLVEIAQTDVNCVDDQGNTALHTAFLQHREAEKLQNAVQMQMGEEVTVEDVIGLQQDGGANEEGVAQNYVNHEGDDVAGQLDDADDDESGSGSESDDDDNSYWSEDEIESVDDADDDGLNSFAELVEVLLEGRPRVLLPNHKGDNVLFLACSDPSIGPQTLFRMVQLGVGEGLFSPPTPSCHSSNQML